LLERIVWDERVAAEPRGRNVRRDTRETRDPRDANRPAPKPPRAGANQNSINRSSANRTSVDRTSANRAGDNRADRVGSTRSSSKRIVDDSARRPRRDVEPQEEQYKPRRRFRRRLLRFCIGFFFFGVIAFGIGVAVAFSYIESVPVPPDQVQVQTAYVYASGGERLATLSNGENRESVTLDRVPMIVRNAVLAAEDRRFYEHGGVDPIGVLRALYQDVRSTGRRQGGSTITQQYVKNVYVGREASLRRKVREAAIAVKLERKLSKDQILERYLNTIYFGRGAYGIQAASKAFFRKDVSELTLLEASYLAALIRGPESTDIANNPKRADQRRTFVLKAMVETGAITDEQRNVALTIPLSAIVSPRRPTTGTRYDQSDAGVQFAVDYARRMVVEQFGETALETQGLRITTTIDLKLQRIAQKETFKKTLNRKGDPDAAVIVEDHGGNLLAMVGGRDWADSKVNLAVGRGGGGQGRAGGSTFKAFALATVVRQGYTVESAFPAPKSIVIPQDEGRAVPWKVSNYEPTSFPTMNLIDATRLSVNTVYAQLVSNTKIGPQAVADTATLLGVTSPLQAVDSIVLGTQDVAPLEMADAFRTFANRGVASGSNILLKVTDANGRELSLKGVDRRRVLDERSADVVNSVLQRVVKDGTGVAAAVPGIAVAGKTGTTQDYNDAWFIGYTAKQCCVVSIWMGYAEGGKQMLNVHGRKVSGGSFPAELFARITKQAVALHPATDSAEGKADDKSGAKSDAFAKITSYPGDVLGESRRSVSGASAVGDSGSTTKTAAAKKPQATAVDPAPSDTTAQTPEPVQAGDPLPTVPGAVPVVTQSPDAETPPEPTPLPTVAPPSPDTAG
jgi:membrane peptidoglycan carboxypeptidase